MIEIALSVQQRRDPRCAGFKDTVINGPVTVQDTFQEHQLYGYDLLLAEIRDEVVKPLLADSHNSDPNSHEKIVLHFNSVLSDLKHSKLYPGQRSFQSASVLTPNSEQPTDQQQVLLEDLQNKEAILNAWRNLESDLLYVAERLWRDAFIAMATEEEVKRNFQRRRARRHQTEPTDAKLLYLELLIRWSRQLLLLRIQVMLYRNRALKNFNWFQVKYERGDRKRAMRQQIHRILNDYKDTLKQWDAEIKKLLGKGFFVQDYGDQEHIKTLPTLFGPEFTSQEEIGWLPFAESVREMLRFQYYDFRLWQRRLKRQYFKAAGYVLLRISTGYGSDPGQFFRIALLTFSGFSALYFVNDFFNNGFASPNHTCYIHQTQGLTWWEIIIHYIYLAVTNMTSLGSNSAQATFCGGTSTSIILVISSFLGYFLLAMLAALFIQKLTESER